MASGKALKNFTVTYRRKSGDMSTKTSPATGPVEYQQLRARLPERRLHAGHQRMRGGRAKENRGTVEQDVPGCAEASRR